MLIIGCISDLLRSTFDWTCWSTPPIDDFVYSRASGLCSSKTIMLLLLSKSYRIEVKWFWLFDTMLCLRFTDLFSDSFMTSFIYGGSTKAGILGGWTWTYSLNCVSTTATLISSFFSMISFFSPSIFSDALHPAAELALLSSYLTVCFLWIWSLSFCCFYHAIIFIFSYSCFSNLSRFSWYSLYYSLALIVPMLG